MSIVPKTYDQLLHLAIVIYDAGQADAQGTAALTIADPSVAALLNDVRAYWQARMRHAARVEVETPDWLRQLQEEP